MVYRVTPDVTFKGRIAFAVVIPEKPGPNGEGWILGVAEENQAGYRPYLGLFFPTEDEARQCADQLNDRLCLSRHDAALIIASSMRIQNLGRQLKR